MKNYFGQRVQIREVRVVIASGAAYSQGRTFTDIFVGTVIDQAGSKFIVKGLGELKGRVFMSADKSNDSLQYHLYHKDGKKETYLSPLAEVKNKGELDLIKSIYRLA